MRRRLPPLGLALALAAAPLPALAEGCRLALSLAIDVSSSVNDMEYALQSSGLARALVAPEVVAAFLSVPGQTVALHVFEWSGRQQQAVRQDWVDIRSAADLEQVAARLRGLARSHTEFPTALGFAMGFGVAALQTRGACDQLTLDIAGDGTNNDGFPPDVARAAFPLSNVVVNGLVIGESAAVLRDYFERNVIHGPGAFVEVARGYADFEEAMRRKLVREVGAGAFSQLIP